MIPCYFFVTTMPYMSHHLTMLDHHSKVRHALVRVFQGINNSLLDPLSIRWCYSGGRRDLTRSRGTSVDYSIGFFLRGWLLVRIRRNICFVDVMLHAWSCGIGPRCIKCTGNWYSAVRDITKSMRQALQSIMQPRSCAATTYITLL